MKAVISEKLPREVLWSPRELIGLRGEPQNLLIPPRTQKIGGGPIFNSTRVRLKRAEIEND